MRMYPRFFGLLAVLTAIVLFSGITPVKSDSYTIYFESDRDGDYRIYRVEGAGDIAVTEPGCRHPSVTADNSMLFYTRITETLWGRFWNIFYLENGEETKLTMNEIYDELDPVVSRDGNFVAYTAMRAGNLEIITLPMAQNELQLRITDNQAPDELPALATGEEYVYWTGRTGNHSFIFKAPGNGEGEVERISTDPLAWEEHPSVSANGRYMVYTAVLEEVCPVEETTEEETVEEETTEGETASIFDGMRIADSSKYPGMGGTPPPVEEEEEEPEVTEDDGEGVEAEVEIEPADRGNYEIWIMDLDTGIRTRLTDNPAWDGNPSISSDGNVIVFTSDRDGNLEIYQINRDGSGLMRLTVNEVTDDFATIT